MRLIPPNRQPRPSYIHQSYGIAALSTFGPFSVTRTVSSIRTPPKLRQRSIRCQFTLCRCCRRRLESFRILEMKYNPGSTLVTYPAARGKSIRSEEHTSELQ